MFSEETREGLIANVILQPTRMDNNNLTKLEAVSVDLIPIYIEDYHQPRFIDDIAHWQKIFSRIIEARAKL